MGGSQVISRYHAFAGRLGLQADFRGTALVKLNSGIKENYESLETAWIRLITLEMAGKTQKNKYLSYQSA